MTKEEKISLFNPNGIGSSNGNLFGLPFTPEEAEMIVIPVPWEVTVSYTTGTALGPKAILEASPQLDLYDVELKDAWKRGVCMLPAPDNIKALSDKLREKASRHIEDLENDGTGHLSIVEEINKESINLKNWVYQQAKEWTEKGKQVCLLGRRPFYRFLA